MTIIMHVNAKNHYKDSTLETSVKTKEGKDTQRDAIVRVDRIWVYGFCTTS